MRNRSEIHKAAVMKPLLTKGIVLKRVNYGEADRIVTFLTPEHGKLSLMVRGVRKLKSKLAGGIELFSVSDLTFVEGKRDLGTLISSRLDVHYGRIVKNIDRVQLGYELINLLNRATEDHPEPAYFHLLQQAFAALDSEKINEHLIKLWFQAQLLQLAGHAPNLQTDAAGKKLVADQKYNFDFENMTFAAGQGTLTADHIKALRLLFGRHQPADLQKVDGLTETLSAIEPLIRTMLTSHIRV